MFYTTGGTIEPGKGLYLSRQADEDLLQACLSGEFAFVLAPRQIGKSSLMSRTANTLRSQNIQALIIDLQGFGVNTTAEQWYLGLLIAIEAQLMLETDPISWWAEHDHLGITRRLTLFFETVLLKEISDRIVIFVDEIDTVLSLDFTDDFFIAIRYFQVNRAQTPDFNRLSFVLLGVATPGDLISDRQRTPFNVGKRIDLTDFSPAEAATFATGLSLEPDHAQEVLQWVLDWTGGHPYLTQRLCSVLTEQRKANPENSSPWTKAEIDRLVAETFLGSKSKEDNNLQFVRDMLTKRSKEMATALVEAYREVWRGKGVEDEEQSLIKSLMKLSGIVKREEGRLVVRNRIYRTVFDRAWIEEHLPETWWDKIKPALPLIAASFGVTVVVSVLGLVAYRNAQRAEANAQQVEQERDRAEQNALEARQNALNAEQNALEADRQKGLAEDRAVKLEAQTKLAQQNAARAVSAQVEAERQAEISKLREQAAVVLNWLPSRNAPNALALALQTYDQSRSLDVNLRTVKSSLLSAIQEEKEVNRFHGPKDFASSIAFSPDGKYIISGSGHDASLWLWNVHDNSIGRSIRHPGWVEAVAFSPDGKIIASGCNDTMIRLWDLKGKPIGQPFQGHTDRVSSVAFSPDGKIIASGSADATIRLWNLQGQPIEDPFHVETFVRSVAFSPDGKLIASNGSNNTLRLWDLKGNPIGQPFQGHTDGVDSLAFSPDGKNIVSGSFDRSIRLWDLQGNVIGQAVHQYPILSVVFSPDGKTILSGSTLGSLYLWDFRGALISKPFYGQAGGVESVAFSPDGKNIVSGGDHEDKTLRLWNLKGQLIGQPFQGHTSSVFSVAFSPDGKNIVSRSDDYTLRRWNLGGQAIGEPLQNISPIASALSPDKQEG